ncbi:gamma carbonic anhydrase family protein [Paracoccus sp. Z118]|uniref:gamma carbonic anhydrase family protein n=1 Tax=Paracoccus sp. Z118 TaxID=2851017 RepID=UPI001C2C5FCC|nr:gamma carbonic anhydrase family protein [Paracoccus sp. Z118]MBV0890401.1 gamma carbonic anhydrase family protein [Paracoccus sp. Z118]
MIWELDGVAPKLGNGVWVAPDAQVMGRVMLEDEVSVWWGAVLRGDSDDIRVGAGSNVQDHAVFHVDPGHPLTIGANVTVGHRAILHGCTVGDGALIGMGAIVLNGAVIGPGALIGAGALIPEGKQIPAGALVMGAPGKVVRMLDDEAQAGLLKSAEGYRTRARQYRAGLRRID